MMILEKVGGFLHHSTPQNTLFTPQEEVVIYDLH